ncbi:MAG: DUF3558 family protein [Rhodococcus sp.]|nr:DUF3558 family protein [Rhodococcus sp. (in: high G+C Gram-positive bacteria)]
MTSRRVTAGAAALLAAITFGATGCSNDDTSETTTLEKPWDPCTLSDETLQKATIDPATQGPALAAETSWEENCGWKTHDGTGVSMNALSTATVEQFRERPSNIDFRTVTVGDRSAVTFRTEGDERGTFCYLVVPFQGEGLVLMQVARSAFTKEATPMCEVAVQIGDALVAEIP